MSETSERVGINITNEGVALSYVDKSAIGADLKVCEYRRFDRPSEIPSILESLAHDLNLFEKDCVLVLNPSFYEVFLVDAIEFGETDKVSKLKESVEDLLDFPVDKAILEYVELPEPEGSASAMGYVIAAQKEKVEELVDLAQELQLNIVAVDIAELVLRNVAMSLPEAEQGTLFLYLSEETKQLLYVKNCSIGMMRSIEIDLSSIPSGSSEFGEQAPVGEFVDALTQEIERSINYCETTLGVPGIQQVVIAPSHYYLDEAVAQVAQNTSMAIRTMALEEVVTLNDDVQPEHQLKCLLSIGAALREEVLV